MRRLLFRHDKLSGTLQRYIVVLICGFAITASTAIAQNGGGDEEGTFLQIDATSGSKTVNGDVETTVKPDSQVQISIQPGSTHTVATDSGGNFALDRQKLSTGEVNEIHATFTVPVCLWQYSNPARQQGRTCVETTNQFTMRWRKLSSDGKVSGNITPSGSAILNTGSNSQTDLATPAGSGTGNFEVPPIMGGYSNGNGTLETTVINVVKDGLTNRLIDLPSYTVTMTVETKNTRGMETGLGIK